MMQIYSDKPENFSPSFEVVTCYMRCGENYLFLKRSLGKDEGGKWCIPGGKKEPKETLDEAICREILEETNIPLEKDSLVYLGKLYLIKKNISYTYHMYDWETKELPKVSLNNEHTAFCWLSLKDAFSYPIITGTQEIFQHIYQLKNRPLLQIS